MGSGQETHSNWTWKTWAEFCQPWSWAGDGFGQVSRLISLSCFRPLLSPFPFLSFSFLLLLLLSASLPPLSSHDYDCCGLFTSDLQRELIKPSSPAQMHPGIYHSRLLAQKQMLQWADTFSNLCN